MKTTYGAREFVAAAWILILLTVGVLAVRSATGWAVLILLAGSGVIMLRRLWREPSQTMSQSIDEARR